MKLNGSTSRTATRVRRWPLILIASPAAVAIWSGWVGLAGMCGFGLVQPLPGIVPWHLDTRITLSIGVEAYAAYALGVWISPKDIPAAARSFAKRSATGSLLLGMGGQVIFHLLAAAHRTAAPWLVVMAVSCLPVAVLGFGAGLTHLLRADESEQPQSAEADATGEPEAVIAQASTPPSRVPSDAESAAAACYEATVTAGWPMPRNQLMTRFGLTRGQADRIVSAAAPETRTGGTTPASGAPALNGARHD